VKKPAVFLDRDGTINEQMGYINHVSRFVMLPGAGPAIRRLNEAGILAILVSNQSGVARGYFPIELVNTVHAALAQRLAQDGAFLDGVFFCPHHPQGQIPAYRKVCDCRKPRTGMIQQACAQLPVDRSRSYVVGDRCSDLQLARRADMKGILVRTGYGEGDLAYVLPGLSITPDFVAADLAQAVEWIVGIEGPGGLTD
jgi:D-glycero-D-manno-heptose 1,7-bisphosphate phosphatase